MTLFLQNHNKYENITNNYINHMNPSMPNLGRIDPKIAGGGMGGKDVKINVGLFY